MHRAVLALVLCLPLTGLAQTDPSPGTPRITCDEPVWDFGLQPQLHVMKNIFRMKNEGTGLLRIQTVTASCGCTVAVLGKKDLQPGEVSEVEVTFETRTFSGPIAKVLQVVSNDPRMPRYRLVCKGRVTPPYWVEPREVHLGEAAKTGGSEFKEFKIVFARNTEGEIKDFRPSSELLEIVPVEKKGDGAEREDGGREFHYKVRLKPGHPVGMLRENVVISTSVARIPVTTLSVRGTVAGEIEVNPRTFNLGRVKAGEGAERTIDIVKSGDANLEILEVDASPSQIFSARLEEVEKGRHYRVVVTLSKEAKAKYWRGSLTVRTNCPGEDTHKAWFYALVR